MEFTSVLLKWFGYFIVYCVHLKQYQVRSANLTHAEQLFSNIFSGYNPKIFPLINQDDTVNISMSVNIVSLNNFEEISGQLDVTLIFFMSWKDERLIWTPADFGGKISLLSPKEDIWRPVLFVIQSFEKIQEVGNVSLQPRIWFNGTITWNPGMVLKVSCTVDVTYFPFDVQTCPIMITGWSYTNDEIRMKTTKDYVETSFYSENTQWHLQSTKFSTYTSTDSSFPPTVYIDLILKRRSNFFIVYIIVPIIFLGIINNLVFLMPVHSGERTSVAVTIFLSFVVYMEMINNTVPESSSPVAYIYYYIMFLLVYSSSVLFLCILSLRIHDCHITVPQTLKIPIFYLRFWCFRKKPTHQKVSPKRSTSLETEVNQKENPGDQSLIENEWPEITWRIVGDTFDKYCMLVLYTVFGAFTTSTFVQLYTNKGF